MQQRLLIVAALLLGAFSVNAANLCDTYTVKDGDSIETIAAIYGISPASNLADAVMNCPFPFNVPDGLSLNVGQTICLDNFPASCANVILSPEDKPSCKLYEFQIGDTLEGIGGELGIVVNDLLSLNDDVIDASSPIQPGTLVRLPGWVNGECLDPNYDVESCRAYRAKEGDSLNTIATAFRVSMSILEQLNPEYIGNVISIGSFVKIPPHPETCTTSTIVDGPSAVGNKCRFHTIKTGDNLALLAENYGYSLTQVLTVNPELNDNPALLQPGFKVKLVGWTDDCGEGFEANGTAPPSDGGTVVIPPSSPTVPSPPMPNMIPPPLSTMTPPPMPSAAPAPAPIVAPAPAPAPSELQTTDGASKIAATVASVVAAVFLLF
jgi:LysM repeat protein